LPPLYPKGYLGGSIATENAPTRVASYGSAPPSVSNNPLIKRAKECLCVRSKAATVLYRKWDHSLLPPMDHGKGPFRGLVGVTPFLSSTSLAVYLGISLVSFCLAFM